MLGYRRLAGSRQTNTQEGTGQQGTGVGSNVQSVVDSWKYKTGAYGTRALSSRRGKAGQFASPIAFFYIAHRSCSLRRPLWPEYSLSDQ